MIANLFHRLRLAATGLTLALVAHGAAHAGLISGEWDPGFGPALPNLSWQVRSKWLVPNGCSNQIDGVYSTGSGPCQGTLLDPLRLLGVWVRWFDTNAGNPNDFYQQVFPISAHAGYCESVFASSEPNCAVNMTSFPLGSEPLTASAVRVEQGQIVGLNTNAISFLTSGWPTSAGNHQYDLNFTTNGPIFTCTDCGDGATADNTNLTQFLVTYTSNDTSVPKFTNSSGAALGAVLDGQGNFLGQRSVPEPGTLILALAALTAFGWSRRRRV